MTTEPEKQPYILERLNNEERYKMALEAIIETIGHGMSASWSQAAFSARDIAKKALGKKAANY